MVADEVRFVDGKPDPDQALEVIKERIAQTVMAIFRERRFMTGDELGLLLLRNGVSWVDFDMSRDRVGIPAPVKTPYGIWIWYWPQ